MVIEKRYARVGPVDLYYQVCGAGEPLLLIHGLSGSTRWWRHNVEAFARQFRVYLIDLIGFGRSRGRHRFVLHEAAVSLQAWMTRVGLEQVSVVGHSMGGFIAADLAARYPAQVDRLVLVDAAVFTEPRTHVQHALGLLRAVRRLPLDFFPVLVADAYQAGPASILRAGLELVSTRLDERLAAIQAPALVVWGEHDRAVPVAVGHVLSRRLGDARLVVIEGAGHNPMWDRPEAFNDVVLDFLTIPRPAALP